MQNGKDRKIKLRKSVNQYDRLFKNLTDIEKKNIPIAAMPF
jgi:hypothetical protein